MYYHRCNQPKSLSGIETKIVSCHLQMFSSCNQPKSLSGIETWDTPQTHDPIHPVAINLNPYQGLKQTRQQQKTSFSPVAINLNPYQGLKHGLNYVDGVRNTSATIKLNPY